MRDVVEFVANSEWRTVPSQALEDLLLLGGYFFELKAGRGDDATRDLRGMLDTTRASAHDPGEFLNAAIAEGLAGRNAFWRTRYVQTGRRLVSDLCRVPAIAPPDLSSLPPRSFRVEFSRTFNLPAGRAGTPARLRIPLPVEDGHLTDLTVSTDAPGAEVRVATGRIEARVIAPAPGPFTLAASFSFTAHPGLPLATSETPADLGLWLSGNEGPIQVSERVRALAASLDREGSSAFDRVMAFRDHLIDTMASGMIHSECLNGSANIDWLLDNRWFDCRTGSALLAALCRARDIPARMISGYLLWGAPTEHYWVEAWLPDRGWTSFDLLTWDLSAGGEDDAWRNLLAGAIDYRMKTQVLPHIFTGAPGVTMTAPWHRLVRYIPDGTEIRYISIPDGDLLYADRIRVFTG